MQYRLIYDTHLTSPDWEEAPLLSYHMWPLLIVSCDVFGRLEARPALLRARLYPQFVEHVSLADIDAALKHYESRGMVERYEVDGKQYLQIVNFDRYQSSTAQHRCGGKYPAPADASSSAAQDELQTLWKRTLRPKEVQDLADLRTRKSDEEIVSSARRYPDAQSIRALRKTLMRAAYTRRQPAAAPAAEPSKAEAVEVNLNAW